VEAYREALRLKPDDAEAWYNLGVSYGKLGRCQEAVEAYREALRLKPDFAEAWVGLGYCLFHLRQPERRPGGGEGVAPL
jgi:cytochrome c-type biogenesis protein CcmH/NrfG